MTNILRTSPCDLLRLELLHRDDRRILFGILVCDKTERMIDSTDVQQTIVFDFFITDH